jgi:hypothetical protein
LVPSIVTTVPEASEPSPLAENAHWYSVVYVIVWLVWDGTSIEPEAGEATYLTPEPPEIGEETLHE